MYGQVYCFARVHPCIGVYHILYSVARIWRSYCIACSCVNYLSKIRLCTHHNIDSNRTFRHRKRKRGRLSSYGLKTEICIILSVLLFIKHRGSDIIYYNTKSTQVYLIYSYNIPKWLVPATRVGIIVH